MDLNATVTAVVKGCFDSIKGIMALFSMNDEIDDKTRQMSPFRNSNFRGSTPEPTKQITKINHKSKITTTILLCSSVNGVMYLSSIALYKFILLGIVKLICSFVVKFVVKLAFDENICNAYLETMAYYSFNSLWLVPFYVLSRILNCLWFQDIASYAYKYRRGRPVPSPSLGASLADVIFSTFLQFLFLIQIIFVKSTPIYPLGHVFGLIHSSLSYALYAFEYKWFYMGWEVHRRLSYIEKNWPYFIGFGLPLSILTEITDSVMINAGIYSLIFPFFIISANEASPVENLEVPQLKLFCCVVWLSNSLFTKFFGGKKKDVSHSVQPVVLNSKQQKYRK